MWRDSSRLRDGSCQVRTPPPPLPALAGVVGTHVIAGEAGSPRETQDAIDTVASEVSLVPRERPSPPPGTPVLAGRGGHLLMDGEGPPPQGDELRNADSRSPPLLRCVTVGMGSSPPRSISVGNMVGTGELATHHSPQDESSVPSHKIVRRHCHQPLSDSDVGQFDGCSLCQQAGEHSLRLPLLVDTATSPMDRVPQCPSGSEVPARAIQCPGRSPQLSESSTGCRMVPPSTGGKETDLNLGVPVAGLVRDTAQREAAPVLLPHPGPPGRLRGCLPSPLERPRHVRISSFPPGRESRDPSQRDPKSLDDPGRPSLARESVVRRPSPPPDPTTSGTPPVGPTATPAALQSVPRRRPRPEPSHVATLKRLLRKSGFSRRAALEMSGCVRIVHCTLLPIAMALFLWLVSWKEHCSNRRHYTSDHGLPHSLACGQGIFLIGS